MTIPANVLLDRKVVEDRIVEINESEREKEKRIKRNEDNLRDLQDHVKHPDT